MPQGKEVHREYMRKLRGSQKIELGSLKERLPRDAIVLLDSQNAGFTNKGSQGVTDKRTQHLAESLINPEKRAKLILVSNALDKTMTGLDGKPLRLSGMVHYGYFLGKRVFEGEYGFTFDEIKELL